MKKSQKGKSRVNSIHYIHDPEAAKEWMELLMEMQIQLFLKQSMNTDK